MYSCLSEATYTLVAEQNDKVIGVIMGNAKSDYTVLTHLKYMLFTFGYGIKMKYYGQKSKVGKVGNRRL